MLLDCSDGTCWILNIFDIFSSTIIEHEHPDTKAINLQIPNDEYNDKFIILSKLADNNQLTVHGFTKRKEILILPIFNPSFFYIYRWMFYNLYMLLGTNDQVR